MLEAFRWVEHTRLSIAIRGSTWGFAIIEMVHLLALALLGGAILVLGLRMLGVVLARQPLPHIARGVAPLLLIGLLAIVGSGALLVADGPLRYYANAAFRVKLLLLTMALVCGVPVYRAARHAPPTVVPTRGLKWAAGVSLALWLAIGLAGRAIGVL